MPTAIARTTYERNWPGRDAPPHAYEPGTQTIFLNDSLTQEAWGVVWECSLLTGLDDATLARLRATLMNDLPPGSFVQFALFAWPSTEFAVEHYLAARTGLLHNENLSPTQRQLLHQYTERRAQQFLRAPVDPLIRGDTVRAKTLRLFVAIRQPAVNKDITSPETIAIMQRFNAIRDGLASLGIVPRALNEGEYLALLRKWFKPFEATDPHYDPNLLLGEQWLAPGDDIDDALGETGVVRVNENHIAVMSLNHLPEMASASMMGYLIGDPLRTSDQIGCPYILSWAIHIPNPLSFTTSAKNKQKVVSFQAFGPMLRYVRKLAALKRGLDELSDALDEREMPVEMNFTLLLFGRGEDEVLSHAAHAKSFFASFDLDMRLDRKLAYPTLRNTLPLFASPEAISGSYRWKPMTLKHALQFVPVIGEWVGSHSCLDPGRTPGATLLMQSRRRQPMLYCLYDSNTSYGTAITAESGAGKSYLCNLLGLEYLTTGSKVWAFDNGYSLEPLCSYLEGSHINITDDPTRPRLCFNPFSRLQPEELPEKLDFLTALLGKMAAPRDGLSDLQLRYVAEAIKAAWGVRANAMTITDVADQLAHNEHPDINALAVMLDPWTARGAYATWFEGENNIDFDNAFIVIESKELENKPELREVLLMQMLSRIADDMKSMPRTRQKVVIFDESRDFLEVPSNAKVLEKFYSQVRKYLGSPIIVLQSLHQLYATPVGKVIEANAPNRIVMRQTSAAIAEARQDNRMPVGDYGFTLIQSVTTVPGRYAEAFIYNESTGWGVAQVVADPFLDVLFDTRGSRHETLKRLRSSGLTVAEAVEQIVCDENRFAVNGGRST